MLWSVGNYHCISGQALIPSSHLVLYWFVCRLFPTVKPVWLVCDARKRIDNLAQHEPGSCFMFVMLRNEHGRRWRRDAISNIVKHCYKIIVENENSHLLQLGLSLCIWHNSIFGTVIRLAQIIQELCKRRRLERCRKLIICGISIGTRGVHNSVRYVAI
jgi:hypothetical protein